MSEAPRPAAGAGTIKVGDLTVNRLGFGAMRVAGPDIWGEPKDRAAMRRLLLRAFELGHDFFDTADSYGPDVSEILIAEALHPYPKGLVIATKGGLTRPSRHRWDENGRPEHLRRAVEGSLRRLRVERSARPAPSGYQGRNAMHALSQAASTPSDSRLPMLYSFCTETIVVMRRATSSWRASTLEMPRCRILPARCSSASAPTESAYGTFGSGAWN